jgi:ornithine carbamoyltransferase
MTKRDFLTLSDVSHSEFEWLFKRALFLKAARKKGDVVTTLRGRSAVLLFEKASTRTRVSFECAMAQLGGHALTLPVSDSQLSRGEPLSDTARVLSSYADVLVIRTFAHARLQAFAAASTVPVVNALTDEAHPAQLLADLLTIIERENGAEAPLAALRKVRVAFVGDGATNMALSWIEASRLFEFELVLASPARYAPPRHVMQSVQRVRVVEAPQEAVAGADVVVTDVWTSMGQEAESAERLNHFAGFMVDNVLMRRAASHAYVLHCLPAHRGEEIAASVLEGPQSAVWQEAENRMHAQKALLELLLCQVRPELFSK